MPLFVDTVSKIYINRSLIINPTKYVLSKYLNSSKQIIPNADVVITNSRGSNIKFGDMTIEQKRKYLLLKYIRQYT